MNMPMLEDDAIKDQKAIKLLVVEDDPDLREALADTLELAGYQVAQADSGEDALLYLKNHFVEMVVSDVSMGGMDGHQLLAEIQRRCPQTAVLLITAFGSIHKSVEAIRSGAVDYLVKPFKPEVLVDTVARYVSPQTINLDGEPIAEETSSRQLLGLSKRVAAAGTTVLICGESGTGKEVLAQYIHRHSSRAKQPFIAINCAAIPDNMLESMLFGHEKGAFTGAYTSAAGKFELANGGSLLLDEISEMSVSLQAKLLRVLQEQEVERLGGRKTIPLDVRIIATTNRALKVEVEEGHFREDLYYRLNVFPLTWLPLRERPKDILPLAQRLIDRHVQKMNHVKVTFDQSAINCLLTHQWPGNVRELENVVQRALILQSGNVISENHLHLDPLATGSQTKNVSSSASLNGSDWSIDLPTCEKSEKDTAGVLGNDLKYREFEIIIDMLRDSRGSRKNAAEKLGISPRTLRYKLAKMREYGIDIEMAVGAG